MIDFKKDFQSMLERLNIPQQAEQERQQAKQEQQQAEQEQQRAEQERQQAKQERQQAEQERQRAEQERQRAEQERQQAKQEQQQAEQERQEKEKEQQQAEQKRQEKEKEQQQAEQERQEKEREHQIAEREGQRPKHCVCNACGQHVQIRRGLEKCHTCDSIVRLSPTEDSLSRRRQGQHVDLAFNPDRRGNFIISPLGELWSLKTKSCWGRIFNLRLVEPTSNVDVNL